MRLFPRTFLYTLALMLTVVAVAHILLYAGLPQIYNDQQQRQLAAQSAALLNQLQQESDTERAASVAAFAAQWTADVSVQIGDFSYRADLLPGTVESPSGALENAQVITEMTDDGLRISLARTPLGGADYFHVEERLPDGAGYLQALVSRQHIEDARGALASFFPVTAGASLILCALFSFMYARGLTRPIESIGRSVRRMQALDPNARCPVKSHDEIARLARNINVLYERLLESIDVLHEQRRRIETADANKINLLRSASHELKTPVTAVSVMLENMLYSVGKYKDRDTYLGKCKGLMDEMARMIESILDATRLEVSPDSEDFLLTDALTEVAEPYLILARSRGLELRISETDPIRVHLPRASLDRVLSNLLSNAVLYASPGGRIEILSAQRTLSIRNECSKLDEGSLEHVFEPFYRAPEASQTSGNGLGLYFVSNILSALDLTFSFGPADDFPGMEFRIFF